MIAPLRFGVWIDGRTYNHSKVSVFEPQDVFDKIKNALRTLKTSSTKYDIAYNTLSCTILIFSLVKTSLWDKTQGCRLPGNFSGALGKKGGERDEKSKL